MKTLNINIPGLTIACKIWGSSDKPPVMALHGWLDNANSFDLLAPYFKDNFYLIAIDFPGHGHSSHLPAGCHYHFTDGIFIIIELLNALQLDKAHLLGHSMGACLASLVGGVVPERILSLALIEGLGPISHPAKTACAQLSKYAHAINSKTSKSYPTFASAALARALKGYVSLDIAKILCERGLTEKDGQFYWQHDQRLLIPSPLRMTETQILSCLQEIRAKTYLLLANQGFTFDKNLLQERVNSVKNLELNSLDGGHHIHMEQPEVVANLLTAFFKSI